MNGGDRRMRAWIWALIALAFAVRVWGLAHNLPYRTYIEEDEFVYTALKYGTGDLNPHWFFHPPLYTYALFSLYGLYYLAGTAAGWFAGPRDLVLQYIVDPSAFYVIARGLSALLVVPTLLALAALVRRLYAARVGLMACAFLAVMPLGVWYAHFGCTEPLVMLFAVLAALCSARVMEGGGLRWSLLAGAAAGLTAGSKYIGAVAIALPVVAHLAAPGGRRPRRMAASLAAAAAAFLAACPQIVLSPREFLDNIMLLASQPISVGEYGWVEPTNLHVEFARYYMPRGMGTALTWLSIAGVLLLWLRRRRGDILIAVVPTLFYAVIGFSRLYYDRYMIVCYPFFAIAAAALVDAVASRCRRRAAAAAIICGAVAAQSLVESVRRVAVLVLPDTSFIAAEWIRERLPADARLLVDVVPVPMNEESIAREQALKIGSPRSPYGYRELSGFFFDLQREAARGRKAFDVSRILHPRGFHMVDDGKGYEEEWMTPELMREMLDDLARYDYAVVSDHKAWRYGRREELPERFRFMNDFYRTIGSRGTLVATFAPVEGESQGTVYFVYRLDAAPEKNQRARDRAAAASDGGLRRPSASTARTR
ncbi:MAG: glycosyltransferase family 39 protein [bacterium]|nr:glycosyltransferase family 39 protein [bacterium]